MKHPAKSSSNQDPAQTAPQRRPYEPPAIEETSAFETLALACGQNEGGAYSCTGNPYYPGSENYDNS